MKIIDTVKIIRGETDTASQIILLKGMKETGAAECVFDRRKRAGVPVIRVTHGGGRGGHKQFFFVSRNLNSKSTLQQICGRLIE